jgi:hypothetical protein
MQQDELYKNVERFMDEHFADKIGVKIVAPSTETPSYIISVSKSKPIEKLLDFMVSLYHKEQRISAKNQRQIVTGFDCEFDKNKVATIQIGTRSLSLIFQMVPIMKESETFPAPLKKFIENQNVIKCGVFIHNDKKLLLETFGKNGLKSVPSLVDLGDLAVKEGLTRGDYRSLKDFASELLKLTNNRVISNGQGKWSSEDLSSNLIRYAGLDAHIGYRTAEVLYSYLSPEKEGKTLFQWIQPFISKKGEHIQKPVITRQELKLADEADVVQAQRRRLAKVKNSDDLVNKLSDKKRKREHQSAVQSTLDDILSEMKTKQPDKKKHKQDDNIMLNLV